MPTKKKSKKAAAVRKGNKYFCRECGLVVSIDETCGCVDMCDIVCCGRPMKKKTRKVEK